MESEDFSHFVTFVTSQRQRKYHLISRRTWWRKLDLHVPRWREVVAAIQDAHALDAIKAPLKGSYYELFELIFPFLSDAVLRQAFEGAGKTEQGMVSYFISKRPQERREIFTAGLYLALGTVVFISWSITMPDIAPIFLGFLLAFAGLFVAQLLLGRNELRVLAQIQQHLSGLGFCNAAGFIFTCRSCGTRFQAAKAGRAPKTCRACGIPFCPKCRSKESGMCPAHHEKYLQISRSTRLLARRSPKLALFFLIAIFTVLGVGMLSSFWEFFDIAESFLYWDFLLIVPFSVFLVLWVGLQQRIVTICTEVEGTVQPENGLRISPPM